MQTEGGGPNAARSSAFSFSSLPPLQLLDLLSASMSACAAADSCAALPCPDSLSSFSRSAFSLRARISAPSADANPFPLVFSFSSSSFGFGTMAARSRKVRTRMRIRGCTAAADVYSTVGGLATRGADERDGNEEKEEENGEEDDEGGEEKEKENGEDDEYELLLPVVARE